MKRISSSLALGLLLPAFSIPAMAQTVVNAPPSAAPGAPAGVAADVNGEKIMSADLNRLVDGIKGQNPSLVAADVRTQVLDELITTRLLAQEAKRRKIVGDATIIDTAIAGIKSGFKTDAEFRAALQKEGKTPDDLRRVIGEELAIREMTKQITADVAVSGEDIGTYYRAHLNDFTVPEGVKLRHILLAINPGAPAPEKERVKKRALDLIKQLNNKAGFDAIAKANSDDPANKDTGGDLGARARDEMPKPLSDAAFAAPVGKIVGPIETDFGIHIIRVDEKIPQKVLTLAEVQANPEIGPTLKALLLKAKMQARVEETIAKLKTSGKIKKYA